MQCATFKKDPEIANKVLNLVESGYNPEEICKQLINEKEVENNKNSVDLFSDEILIISQALAFRYDISGYESQIKDLLNKSYKEEVNGNESFRLEPVIDNEYFDYIIESNQYQWCIAECPNGRDVIDDGSIIGVCCFSTDGTAKRNGEIIGKLGSIRYLSVLPQLRGYCIGQRLLDKVEHLIRTKYNCTQVMSCLPSTRASLHNWIERRNYKKVKEIEYPYEALNQILTKPVSLIIFIKSFDSQPASGNMSLPPLWRNIKSIVDIPDVD